MRHSVSGIVSVGMLAFTAVSVYAATVDDVRRAREQELMAAVATTPRPASPVALPEHEQCAAGICVKPVACAPVAANDFFHFRESAYCVEAVGEVKEFYAPTPASDAVRVVKKTVANLQIPHAWLTRSTFDGTFALQVDTSYFTGTHADSASGALVIGETGHREDWQVISGPFAHYLREHGLSDAVPVHTQIRANQDGSYHYTLYHPLGAPLTRTLAAKEAPYIDGPVKSLLTQHQVLEGYTRLNRYSFTCWADAGGDTEHLKGCEGSLFFSPYVSYRFTLSFGSPLEKSGVLVWFNKFQARLRPVFDDGLSAYVAKPDPAKPMPNIAD